MTTPPMSNRRAQTRDRLLNAAISLFAEKGILAASVEEICERASFTRGAFYSNFAGKDELVVAVLQRKGEEIIQAANAAASAPVSLPEGMPVDPVLAMMAVFQATVPVDPEWMLARNEIRLYALRNPAVRMPLGQVEAQLDQLMTGVLDAVAAHAGAPLAVPVQQLVIVFNAYYEALAVGAMLMGQELKDVDLAHHLSTLFRAVMASSAREAAAQAAATLGSPHEHPPR